MSDRKPLLGIWLLVGLLVCVIVVPLWNPMRRAWACYQMHLNGARASAELRDKLEGEMLLLTMTSGSQNGQSCTARTSSAFHDSAEKGQSVEVVYFEDRPGECVLSATVELSGVVLWSISAGVGFALLGVIGLGLLLQRSFTRPGLPERRMDVDPGAVLCPSCSVKMAEGYLAPMAGVHWREPEQPLGMPHALGGLPGTVGWRGRPRLHAFRCSGCEVVSFQYGQPRPADPSAI